METIHFFSEKIDFFLPDPDKTGQWLKKSVSRLGKKLIKLNFIFTSDINLLKLNKLYLNHDYFTDILTFDNSENKNDIEGDIYISIDRVKDNAGKYGVIFEKELARVMIHGILHLAGYDDQSEEEKALMREMENEYLSEFNKI